MKQFLLAIPLFLSLAVSAQINPDTVAYDLQRQKINMMLQERTRKFGQYQQSLNQHTGIFGLQTKNDIRNSNTILMDINKTDDDIYVQVKTLLQMTVFAQKQVQDKSLENEERSIRTEKYNLGFMAAINKLRAQNEQLTAQLKTAESTEVKTILGFLLVIVLGTVLILRYMRNKYAPKS